MTVIYTPLNSPPIPPRWLCECPTHTAGTNKQTKKTKEMITEQLTARVTRYSEYEASHTRHVYALDGREVLHACKTFTQYSNGPYYSRVNSCGEYRPQISRDAFNAELKRIMELN